MSQVKVAIVSAIVSDVELCIQAVGAFEVAVVS